MSYQDSANSKLQTAIRKLAISQFIPTPPATAVIFDFDNPQDWKITGDPAKTAINGGPIKAGKGTLDFNVPYMGENWMQFTAVPVDPGNPANVLASKILAGQKTPTAVTTKQATLGVTISGNLARLVGSTFFNSKINSLQMYVDGGNIPFVVDNVSANNFTIPAGFHRLVFKAWIDGVDLPIELPINTPSIDLTQPKNMIMYRRYCIPQQPNMPQAIEFDPGIFSGGKVWVDSISTDITGEAMVWNEPVKLWKQLGVKWPMVMDQPTDIILHTTTDAAGVHYRSLLINGDPIFLDEDIFFPVAPASPDRMLDACLIQNQIDIAKGALLAKVLYRGGRLAIW